VSPGGERREGGFLGKNKLQPGDFTSRGGAGKRRKNVIFLEGSIINRPLSSNGTNTLTGKVEG